MVIVLEDFFYFGLVAFDGCGSFEVQLGNRRVIADGQHEGNFEKSFGFFFDADDVDVRADLDVRRWLAVVPKSFGRNAGD